MNITKIDALFDAPIKFLKDIKESDKAVKVRGFVVNILPQNVEEWTVVYNKATKQIKKWDSKQALAENEVCCLRIVFMITDAQSL